MCRSQSEGGRRCPGGRSHTRQAQAARQRLCRARKALSAAEAAGDQAAMAKAQQRIDTAQHDVTSLKQATERDCPERSAMGDIPAQTAASAAADLGVSLATLYKWLKTGEIRKHGVAGHKDDRGRWVITLLDDAPDAPSVEAQIRAAYSALAARPGAWVSLTDLRPLVDAPRDQLDDVLRSLERRPDVNLVPESNQKTLASEDRDAAVTIGEQPKHLIWFGSD